MHEKTAGPLQRSTEGTLTGERFDTVIVQQLRRADGVIALLSEHAAASAWCQAELCYAHALKAAIAPVRVGPATVKLPEPLQWLQQLQYLDIQDASSGERPTRRLVEHLKLARARRRHRVARAVVAAASPVVAFLIAWVVATNTLNSIALERERTAVVATVRATDKILQRARVDDIGNRWRDDQSLIQRLRGISESPEAPDVQRLNALMIVNRLTSTRAPRNRWYLKSIDWADGDLAYASFSAVTFQSGVICHVQFANTYFGGVVWNQSPLDGRPGLMLSSVRFVRSRFDGGEFAGTGGVDVSFVNSHFTGVRLAVENLSATVFKSEAANSPPGVITDEVSVFERTVIERCVPPPDPKVIEIVPEGTDVSFEGVVFDGVEFKGAIRASWFKNCHFLNSVLPLHVSEAELHKSGNTLESVQWRNSRC
jgi:uncharacterized protein YjbI with pentapeptide repeats